MSFLEGKKESLRSIDFQLAPVDGFSIHAIGKSKFIRSYNGAKLDAFVVCTFVI